MYPEYSRMVATVGQGYVAWLAATVEVGERILRATAAESGSTAVLASAALRVPADYRTSASEDALYRTYDAQRRLLHGIGGLPTLWSMAFLNHFDRARRQHRPL